MDGLPVLPESLRGSIGGARRDRTADLLIANEALSQLSYGSNRLRRTPKHGAHPIFPQVDAI